MTGDDTRTRIVTAASELFAEGGEEATSLRAITRRADVNVAAIHYHFGGRDGLLREMLDRIVAPLNARRHALLDKALADYGEQVPLAVVLDAFLRPDLELLDELRRDRVQVARFLGRAYSQPSPDMSSAMSGQFASVADRLFPLLRAELPEVDPSDLQLRMQLIVALVTHLFATAPSLGESGPLGADDIALQLDRLVGFCAAGLAAPHTKERS